MGNKKYPTPIDDIGYVNIAPIYIVVYKSGKRDSAMDRDVYVLVTAARNEEAFIEKTLQSVVKQSLLPKKWVVVSDRSTDRTDEIVQQYQSEIDFIQLVRIEKASQRNFKSKVNAFNAGYNELKSLEYDYIGNLDADVSFAPDYYERVIEKFRENNRLGLAGGIRFDWHNGKFEKVLCARISVGGPFQLFRRECFETIGGFRPQKLGGEDAIAEISARMHGWQVRSFPELEVYHYRRTGTATVSLFRACFLNGEKNYLLGYIPLFQLARCIYRVREKPYILNSLLSLAGYFGALLRRYHRTVPEDYLVYFKSEQRARLRALFLSYKLNQKIDTRGF